MKKKILLFVSMVAMLVCLFVICASAESRIVKLDYDPGLDCDDSLVSYLDGDYTPYTPSTWASVTGGLDTESRIVITDANGGYYVFPSWYVYKDEAFETNRPGNHNSYKHCIKFERLNAAIAKYNEDNSTSYFAAFSDHKAALVRLEILRGVANISQNTQKFEDCKLLKEVRFPSTLGGIDAQNCFTRSAVEELDLSMTKITYLSNAFASETTNLGKVILPSTCTTINYQAFHSSSLTSINTENVTSYGQHVFTKTTNLKTFVIKEGVTTIPVNFMQNATGLESIVFPSTITTFNGYSFIGNTSLVSVEIKATNLNSIGANSFSGCTALKTVILSDSITTFGEKTFSGCSSLEYFKFPASFTGTSHDLFADCSKLSTLVFPKGTQTIHCQYDFRSTNIKTVVYTGSEDDAFYKDNLLKYFNGKIEFKNHCEVYFDGNHKLDGELTKYFAGEKYLSNYIEECECGNGCGNVAPVNVIAPLFKFLGYSRSEIPGTHAILNSFGVNYNKIAKYNALVADSEKITEYGLIAAGKSLADGSANVVDGKLMEASKKASVSYTEKTFDLISMKISGFNDEASKSRELYISAYILVGGTYYYSSSVAFSSSANETVTFLETK